MTQATPLNQTPICIRCKTHGQSIVRVEGHCEACFIQVYCAPIQKEVRNTEETLQRLNDALYVQLQRLRVARETQAGVRPRNERKCKNNCGFSVAHGHMYQLIWHEENCKFTGPKKEKRASVPRVPKTPKPSSGDDEVFI